MDLITIAKAGAATVAVAVAATKERLGGYFVIEVPDLAAALVAHVQARRRALI